MACAGHWIISPQTHALVPNISPSSKLLGIKNQRKNRTPVKASCTKNGDITVSEGGIDGGRSRCARSHWCRHCLLLPSLQQKTQRFFFTFFYFSFFCVFLLSVSMSHYYWKFHPFGISMFQGIHLEYYPFEVPIVIWVCVFGWVIYFLDSLEFTNGGWIFVLNANRWQRAGRLNSCGFPHCVNGHILSSWCKKVAANEDVTSSLLTVSRIWSDFTYGYVCE